MQYRLNDKIRPEDYNTEIRCMKAELKDSIDYEVKRKNVDTSKKTAVKQLMDYDNFR